MAVEIRAFDWSQTALGPIRLWPEGMVAAVNMMLESPIPATLYWGKQLLMIYNDGYRQIMGSRHPRGLGRPLSVVWAEAWSVIGEEFEGVFTTGVAVQNDEFFLPVELNGKMTDFYWKYSLSPIYDDGRIAGLYNTCVDVTSAVLTARERDGLGRRLAQVLASMSDGSVLVDRNWVVGYMNDAARQANAGIPEMLGRNLWECLPELVYEGSPDLYHFKRAMDEGVGGEFESYYPEPLNHWLCVRVSPTTEGIAIFFQDITQAKRDKALAHKAAEALAASEEELRWTVALSAQLPWTADVDGKLLWVDERVEAAGRRPIERTTGDDWRNVIHVDDVEESAEKWMHAVRTGTPLDREHRLLLRDGTYRWFRSRAQPRRDEAGRILKWYGTSEDIHLRKQTEDALRTSEKLAAVGRLASSIAHEINNPLEAVTNLLYLARTSDDVPDEVLGYLETAERELKRASTITSQTLRFHRQSTRQTEVEFGSLIQEVLGVVHGRLVNSSVATEVRARAEGCTQCFEGEIRQVLLNLIANAIDAMHGSGGGRLLVRTREATEWRTGRRGITVTVGDTGPGMSAEVQRKIFAPFFTTKGAAGTGLGLWVSQEIVTRHGGSLRLRSRETSADGNGVSGCVFTLFLPEEAAERPARRKEDDPAVV